MKNTIALMLAAAALSASCNRGATTTNSDKPTVALVLKTLNHPFFVDMRRGAQEAADRLGVTLQVQAAEREIDALVYRLFDLTPDEIALLESSLEGQYWALTQSR